MASRLVTALGVAASATALAACASQRPVHLTHTVLPAAGIHAAARPTAAHRAASAHVAGRITFAKVPLTGTGHTITIPKGWHASLWARVDDARLEAWTPQGSLLVSSPDDGTVTELTPRKGGAPTTRTVVSGLTNPQGLAFDRLHGHEYLYVAVSNELDRYTWTARGDAAAHRTLVPDLPDTQPAGDDVHRLKNVVVGPDHTVFVDIGSSSNASIPAPVPKGSLPRASVIVFHPDGRLDRVWATGVRNGDGLAIAPDGTLWTAVNERDQIAYPTHKRGRFGKVLPWYVDNHPMDEIARLTPGRDLGWPYCDPIQTRSTAGCSLTPTPRPTPTARYSTATRCPPSSRGCPPTAPRSG
jgi:glucose/arabinose dehydrogenase